MNDEEKSKGNYSSIVDSFSGDIGSSDMGPSINIDFKQEIVQKLEPLLYLDNVGCCGDCGSKNIKQHYKVYKIAEEILKMLDPLRDFTKIGCLPNGAIIWDGFTLLGVKGSTLPSVYYDCYCTKTEGNQFDYNLKREDCD